VASRHGKMNCNSKGMNNMTNNVVYTIEDIRQAISQVSRDFGIKRMTIFGSYARGEATENSDIDFHLIDAGDAWGYFKLCGFQHALEDCLGLNVDVLTTGAMDDKVLENITRDEVLVYEQ
jgi:predicted nucleotidyltransferase